MTLSSPLNSQQLKLESVINYESQSQRKRKKEKPGQRSTKHCPRCDTTKPVSEFHKYSQDASGLQPYCKSCQIDHQRELRQAHSQAPLKPVLCESCGKEKDLFVDHTKSEGFRGWVCNACNSGIGSLGDNIIGLVNGLLYLLKKTKHITDDTKNSLIPLRNKLNEIIN